MDMPCLPGLVNALTPPMQAEVEATDDRELVSRQRPIPIYVG
ncbi:MAG: hypothetical protein CM15mP120_17000 [Pseudomonadota bacterium]|nr:MAG: hypothetical protein CM15mP120_17000 [Pseudomonadota bacterium]